MLPRRLAGAHNKRMFAHSYARDSAPNQLLGTTISWSLTQRTIAFDEPLYYPRSTSAANVDLAGLFVMVRPQKLEPIYTLACERDGCVSALDSFDVWPSRWSRQINHFGSRKQQWAVVRVDTFNNQHTVDLFGTEAEAELICEKFRLRLHHQHYFVETWLR